MDWKNPKEVSEYRKAYYAAHKDNWRIYAKTNRVIHREKRNETIRKWHASHKEHESVYAKAKRLADPEKTKLKDRENHAKYKEKAAITQKIYRETHKEQRATQNKDWCRANRLRIVKNDKYREAKVEIAKAKKKAQYEANKERIKEKVRLWQRNNLERANARKNEWAKEHPDKRKESNRIWYEKHREEALDARKTYRKANPGRYLALSQKRRALKCGVTAESFLPIEIFERDGWKCQLCHRKVERKLKYPNPLSASLDHIIPLSKGGFHSRTNVHLAHFVCNIKAHTGGIKQMRLF